MSDPSCIPSTTRVPSLDKTYGAMLVGIFFSMFLQGVLTLQTVTYYDSYPKDQAWTKLVVATVWCFDTFQLILIAQSAYHYLISNWGIPSALLVSTWELDLNVTFIGLSTFVCQLFFLRRIWVFSGKKMKHIIIVGLLGALCAVTLIVDVVAMVSVLKNSSVAEFGSQKVTILVAFISGAVADVSIALLLSYYIRRNKGGFKKTDSIITLIIRYTITTGVVTSLLGIFTLVAYFLSPDGLIFIGMHFCLGRLYTNALLATLNSRSKLRASLDETTNLQFDTDPWRNESLSMGPMSNLTRTATKNQSLYVNVHKATEVVEDSGDIYNSKGKTLDSRGVTDDGI
ncbi:hypothetical protein BDP27DRAFT_1405646 [Rhodocollybia butyracea]|uniref:DUF6534 domain-containing protein n=1 Tax=Rhodocollybia butyracea TaxID=206335 RepID=A0A9P5PI69_9AGAR|nr:hypothetical protein BDP27DRAFT_1405646 [Rhodocollybia butyracea]